MADEYIVLDQLTDNQNRIIEKMIGETLKERSLETISDERTRKLIEIAQAEGLDGVEAGKLAGHFNAATKMIQQMSPIEKKQFNAALQRKFPSV